MAVWGGVSGRLLAEARGGAGGYGGERMSAAATIEVDSARGYAASLAWSRTAAWERAKVLAQRGVVSRGRPFTTQ